MKKPLVGTMPARERPISERFREAGQKWAEAKRKADLAEELRSAMLEKYKQDLIKELEERQEKYTEAKLERLVKASARWQQYIESMCWLREQENLLWIERRAVELEHSEKIDINANMRTERRL